MAGGGVVGGDGEAECGAAAHGDDVLHAAFSVAFLSDDGGAL